MRVARYENRYVLSCSEHEYRIIQMALASVKRDELPESGLRRSWSRRTGQGGDFVRVDSDRRKEVWDNAATVRV